MKKIILGTLAVSLSGTLAAPSLAAPREDVRAGYDAPSSFVRADHEADACEPRANAIDARLERLPEGVADGERCLEQPAAGAAERCCCEGEEVGEAQECWDWQCAAGVVGGALNSGLVGVGIGTGAGVVIPGLGAVPGALIGGAVGLVGGGLSAYAGVPACQSPPSPPAPLPPTPDFGEVCSPDEETL